MVAEALIPDSAGKGKWNPMSFRPTWSIANFRPVRSYTVSPFFSVGLFVLSRTEYVPLVYILHTQDLDFELQLFKLFWKAPLANSSS